MEKLSHLDICRIFNVPESEFAKLAYDKEFRKRTYRSLIKINHPDTRPPEEREKYNEYTIKINDAYNALESGDYYYYKKEAFEQPTSASTREQKESSTTYKYTYEYERAPDCLLKRKGINLFVWILFWPIRGIIYLLLYLLINLTKVSLALLGVVGFIGGIFIVIDIVKYFKREGLSLGMFSDLWLHAVTLILIGCIIFGFNFIEENGEDWIYTVHEWWRE